MCVKVAFPLRLAAVLRGQTRAKLMRTPSSVINGNDDAVGSAHQQLASKSRRVGFFAGADTTKRRESGKLAPRAFACRR